MKTQKTQEQIRTEDIQFLMFIEDLRNLFLTHINVEDLEQYNKTEITIDYVKN